MSKPTDALRPPRDPTELLVGKMREVAQELECLGRLLDLLAAEIEAAGVRKRKPRRRGAD